MKKIELFEPALCCETGVCGPSVDENLLMITSVFESLESLPQIDASRHNLNSDPDAFIENKTILKIVQEKGNDVLPVTVVDGEIVKAGAYPTMDEISQYTGVVFVDKRANKSNNGGCCGGNSNCGC